MIIQCIAKSRTHGQGGYPRPGGPSTRPRPNEPEMVAQTNSYGSNSDGGGIRRQQRPWCNKLIFFIECYSFNWMSVYFWLSIEINNALFTHEKYYILSENKIESFVRCDYHVRLNFQRLC
jgi:hypothetical protein